MSPIPAITAPEVKVEQWPHGDWRTRQAALYRYCLSLTKSVQDAEDLAQETWLKALGTLQGPGHRNAEAFMLRIAKNTWIDRMRRRAFESRLLFLERPEATFAPLGVFEIERMMGALVKYLSPLQRTVFLLRDVYGYAAAEVAEQLRITVGAVKAALHRARAALVSVREELARETSPASEDEGLLIYLRALASAYQSDEIARLVALAQQDVLPPVTAISLVRRMNSPTPGGVSIRTRVENNDQTEWLAA